MNYQLLYVFHHRSRRYNYNSVLKHYHSCRADKEFFDQEDAFQSFVHRLHSHDYDRDEDADDVMAEGDKSAHEYMDNFIKRNRARFELPMPKEWENPFNMH